MQVDLTQIILWILEALAGFFMVRIYPQIEALIKSKIDTFKQKLEIEKLQKVLMEVDQFADAAEQMAKNNDLDGEWKNNFVLDMLRSNGYDISETLKAYVEAKVLHINQELNSTN